MLKLGIVSAAQLGRPLTRLGKMKQASLLLLRDLAAAPDSDRYDTVLTHVLTANGTWRDTARDRFAALDRLLLRALQSRGPAGRPLTVLDVGVSSGITSVRLYELLKPHFRVKLIATDLMRDAVALRAPAGWAIVFDASRRPLQYVLGRFVLQGQGSESAFYPLNRLLRRFARWRMLPTAAALLERFDLRSKADFETTTIDGFELTKIPLLARETLQALANEPEFQFEVGNVLEPLRHRADVIRAMNVLTPAYFDDGSLRAGVRHCVAALNVRGLLILGRSPNHDPRDVKATIYANDGSGPLQPIHHLNGGYEAAALVEDELMGSPKEAPVCAVS